MRGTQKEWSLSQEPTGGLSQGPTLSLQWAYNREHEPEWAYNEHEPTMGLL